MIINYNNVRQYTFEILNTTSVPQNYISSELPFERKSSVSIQTFHKFAVNNQVKVVARVIRGDKVQVAAGTVRLRITEVFDEDT